MLDLAPGPKEFPAATDHRTAVSVALPPRSPKRCPEALFSGPQNHFRIRAAKTRPGVVSGRNWATSGTFGRATKTPRHLVLAATVATRDGGAAGCVTRARRREFPYHSRTEGCRHDSRRIFHQSDSRPPVGYQNRPTGWLYSSLPTPKWPSRQRGNLVEANGKSAMTPSSSAEGPPIGRPSRPRRAGRPRHHHHRRQDRSGTALAPRAGHDLTVRHAPVPER